MSGFISDATFGAANAAVINIVGNLQPLSQALSRSREVIGSWASNLRSGLSPFAKGGLIIGAITGIASLTAAIIQFSRVSINAFEEAEVAIAKFRAEVNAGGNAAQLTGSQYQELFRRLEDTTTLSEIAGVKMGTSLLKANLNAKNFNRALQLSADLAAAWGITGEDAANRLAISVTNVDVGIRKLRNQFVFTPAQDKALRNATTQLEKQEIVLSILEGRYGKYAEALADTFAGAKAQLAVAFQRTLREVGQELVPVINALVVSLRTLLPVITLTIRLFLKLITPITDVIATIMSLINVMGIFSNPFYIQFMEMLIDKFNIVDTAVKRLTNTMIALGVISKSLEDPFNFNLDKLIKDIKFAQSMFQGLIDAQKSKLTIGDVSGELPDFSDISKEGKNLRGQFESLEQTWKRISSAINEPRPPELQLADSVDKNTEATNKNTSAMEKAFKDAARIGERMKEEKEPSMFANVPGQMAEIIAGAAFGPSAAVAVNYFGRK